MSEISRVLCLKEGGSRCASFMSSSFGMLITFPDG
jgi:hypothetical protein